MTADPNHPSSAAPAATATTAAADPLANISIPPTATTPVVPAATVQVEPTAREIENVERALIDQSARGPVLTFFTTGIFWLLVSVILGYIASKKLHAPDYHSHSE